MSKDLVFDIETSNSFADVGKYDPTLLKVSLVGVYNFADDSYSSYLEPDLPKLWRLMESADRVIGYNSEGFDLPCLNQYYPGDLTKLPSLDLMLEISKVIGFRVKLDDVAHATLGTGKSGNGLMAIEYFRRGEIEKLREYCLQDVKVTKEVYEYGLKNGMVKYKDRMGRVVDVKVNFAPAAVKQAVSMTLPF